MAFVIIQLHFISVVHVPGPSNIVPPSRPDTPLSTDVKLTAEMETGTPASSAGPKSDGTNHLECVNCGRQASLLTIRCIIPLLTQGPIYRLRQTGTLPTLASVWALQRRVAALCVRMRTSSPSEWSVDRTIVEMSCRVQPIFDKTGKTQRCCVLTRPLLKLERCPTTSPQQRAKPSQERK